MGLSSLLSSSSSSSHRSRHCNLVSSRCTPRAAHPVATEYNKIVDFDLRSLDPLKDLTRVHLHGNRINSSRMNAINLHLNSLEGIKCPDCCETLTVSSSMDVVNKMMHSCDQYITQSSWCSVEDKEGAWNLATDDFCNDSSLNTWN